MRVPLPLAWTGGLTLIHFLFFSFKGYVMGFDPLPLDP
jgi:hypothetical protein